MNNAPFHEHLGRTTDWRDISGASQAPTLLLVHGSTLTRSSWLPQIEALSAHYQIITPDLPGHGVLAGFPFSMEGAVQVLASAAEASRGARLLVIGASLGGHVATLFTSRYPDQIAGLVISGASMNFHGLMGSWTRTVGKLMPRLFSTARLQQMAERSMIKKWPSDIVTAIVKAGIYPEGAFNSFIELPKYDFRELVKTIQSPVLILNGEHDQANRKQEQAFLSAAQHGSIKIIDDAGHACAIEKPEAFNQAVLDFAAQVFSI